MTVRLSQEKNVGLETVVATFSADILGVEPSPGMVRIALCELRSDQRRQTVVRNSIPFAHLVRPNETGRRLADVLAAAIQAMNTVTQAAMRLVFVSPTLPQQREHTNS